MLVKTIFSSYESSIIDFGTLFYFKYVLLKCFSNYSSKDTYVSSSLPLKTLKNLAAGRGI
jgi:hypothetical protein